MSLVVLKTPDGSVKQFPLSKTQSLTVGRHEICDVRLDDDGLETIEARISWTKKTYEITAANSHGVVLNGVRKTQSSLEPGDLIHFGRYDLLFTTPEHYAKATKKGGDGFSGAKVQDSGEIGLAAISEERPVWNNPPTPPEKKTPPPAAKKTSPPAAPQKPKKSAPPPAQKPSKKPGKSAPPLTEDPELWGKLADETEVEPDQVEARPMLSRGGESSEGGIATKSKQDEVSPLDKIRETLNASRQRPGQQEITRSPLVIGLALGGLAIVIGAAVLWSVIGREEADRYLSRAREQADQRKYQQSIGDYETFLLQFPDDEEYETARVELSQTRVRSRIDTGAPDWQAGLDEVEGLIERHRDDDDFTLRHSEISDFSRTIALGSLASAERNRDRKYFEVSEGAQALLSRYTGDEERLAQIEREIRDARRKAEATILKHATQDAAVAQMEKLLKEKQPLAAIAARKKLLQQYPELARDPKVAGLLAETLKAEQGLVKLSEEEIPPTPFEKQPVVSPLSLTTSVRASTEELASGRPVYAHARDCLFALDAATGAPLWRVQIGEALPFFPIEVETAVAGLLVFDSKLGELQLRDRATGARIWSQPCPAGVVGEPLVEGMQALVATGKGEIWELNLESGTISSRLIFAQPLSTAPAELPEARETLAVGNQEFAYLLKRQPLGVEQVVHLSHGPGSISAPLLRMGPLMLIAENDRADSCRLRVFDTRQANRPLDQIAEERIGGNVIDPPVLRGKQLFIPSQPERVVSFTVSAEKGQPPLSRVGQYAVTGGRQTATFLTPGPDGLLWMASSAIRKLKQSTDALEAVGTPVTEGLATQPIQMIGDRLFSSRRSPYAETVRFSRLDRNDLNGLWRTQLGDEIWLSSINSNGELICLLESGEIYRLRETQLQAGGFSLSSNARVDLPDTLSAVPHVAAFSDGRFAVATGGAAPALTVIRTTGQIESNLPLDDQPQAAPALIDAGIVVALPGRLKLFPSNSGVVEDYLLPIEEGKTVGWKSLLSLDQTTVLALDSEGVARKIQYRLQPTKHLALVSEIDFEQPLLLPPVVLPDNRVALVLADRSLQGIDVESFSGEEAIQFEKVPTGGPWLAQETLFVQLDRTELVAFSTTKPMQEKFRIPLDNTSVAGTPLPFDGDWIVALADGSVSRHAGADGGELANLQIEGTPAGDPLLFGKKLWQPTADGSLFEIVFPPAPPAKEEPK